MKQATAVFSVGALVALAFVAGFLSANVVSPSPRLTPGVEAARSVAQLANEGSEGQANAVDAICRTRLSSCEVARSELRDTVGKLTAERTEGLEELAFYRGLLGDEQVDKEPRVNSASWRPLGSNRGLLRLVLVRAGGHQKPAQGVMILTLRGQREGQAEELLVEDLIIGRVPPSDFSFQYFLEWETEIEWPRDFAPERLIVNLVVRGQRAPIVESRMWSELEQHNGN